MGKKKNTNKVSSPSKEIENSVAEKEMKVKRKIKRWRWEREKKDRKKKEYTERFNVRCCIYILYVNIIYRLKMLKLK